MKIALIGNMNNNNFALLRYFRDLGFDAHLILFKNDGYGSLSHFTPENDTWEIEKWKPFIHYIDFYITPLSAIGTKFPINILFFLFKIRAYLKGNKNPMIYRTISVHEIESSLSGYDKLIGSGLSGVLLSRIGKKLDIFYPYGMGIEFLGSLPDRKSFKSLNPIVRLMSKAIANAQIKALKNTKTCVTGDLSLTKQTFDEHKINFKNLNLPLVYNREKLPYIEFLDRDTKGFNELIENCDFSVLTHGRQLWVNNGYTEKEWELRSKHNEWLFRSFAEFSKNRPKINSKLFALEYGNDVSASKKLCAELGIDDKVYWLPKMSRRNILFLLNSIHVGVGEFYIEDGVIWGGSGWEVLSVGKPLLQSFNFTLSSFEQSFGYPAPPLLPVKEEGDILDHLLDMCDNPQKAKTIGQDAKKWFNKYNGISLAKEWLELLLDDETGSRNKVL